MSEKQSETPPKPKAIKIANLNNKMHCRYFTQIGSPPAEYFTENELPKLYQVEDSLGLLGSFQAKLITFARITLGALSSIDTYQCAGMDREDFINKYFKEHPNSNFKTPIAIYVYEKI